MNVALIGSGSWGTAVAGLAAARAERVTMWAHSEQTATGINGEHRNPRYLVGYELPDNVVATTELVQAIEGAEAIIFAVPSTRLRSVWLLDERFIEANTQVLSLKKGLEPDYGLLKSENGVHRLVRVSPFDANARRQTSFASLEVMPELDNTIQVDIRPEDIEMQVFRSSGAGGQHVQKTDSAVRITHLPTGLVVECQDERSQRQNKERAMSVLASRLYAMEVEKRRSEEASTRKSLIGSGDRSERIRTYNYPQGRVTDHRINLTLYKLGAIMDGDLDEILTALQNEHRAELLAAMGENA